MRSRADAHRTGRLLVVLSRGAVSHLTERAGAPGAADVSTLRQLGEELGDHALLEGVSSWADRTFPVVRSVSTVKVLELDHIARAGPFPPPRSMAAYWIAVPSRQTNPAIDALNMLRLALLDSRAVESVHLEQSVGRPPVNWSDDAYASSQTHLDAAPTGIDAKWVWQALGLDGAGVDFTDVEMGWNLTHNDLVAKMPPALLTHRNYAQYRSHGTAVLGLVVGVDNAEGIVGIAPGVMTVRLASHWDGESADNVADAIEAAASVMAPGDVLLLETQSGEDGPIETMEGGAEKTAIMTATSKGIIVIEPAGNAGVNLGAVWPSELAIDSGAIIVGASDGTGGAVPHPRNTSSNFGARVDCFATGQGLVSTGYGDLDAGGGNENREYTATFSDTSGASAIVAGAAVLAQHMHWHASATRLDAVGMRHVLRQGGTVQGAMDGHIGVMPNLRHVAQHLCDVYVRDYVGDTGVVPSTGPLSSSPDVIVLTAPVGDPQGSFGEGSGTENDATLGDTVVAGQPHTVYVRLRNRGICPAIGVTVTVYWSEVATLVSPAAWKLIGTSLPVTVPAGDSLTVTAPIPWLVGKVPGAGHYCFVAVVHHPYDPAPPTLPTTDWAGFLALLRHSNNVTWRNFNVVEPATLSVHAGAWFDLQGPPDQLRRFDLDVQQRLPGGASLILETPPQLLPPLRKGPATKRIRIEDGRVRTVLPHAPSVPIPDLWLEPGAKHPCRFFVDGGEFLVGRQGSITLRQLYEGEEVGRVTWVVRQKRRAESG